MDTTSIIARQRRTGEHPLDALDHCVSSRSNWHEDAWDFDPPPGVRQGWCTIIWDERLPPAIIDKLKLLAWSLFVSRAKEKPKTLGMAKTVSLQLRYFGRWMARRNITEFAQITPVMVSVFKDDLKRHLTTDKHGRTREIDVDTNTVAKYLMPIAWVEEQAGQLGQRGLEAIPPAPFGALNAWAVAADIADDVESFTPPLPDEVVLPVVTEAHRWLGAPAEDILRLQRLCLEEREEGRPHLAVTRAIRRMLETFTFSPASEGEEPWHPPFADFLMPYDERGGGGDDDGMDGEDAASPDEHDDGGFDPDGEDRGEPTSDEPKEYYGIDRVRRLQHWLMAACAIVIRFQTGVRHGEILTFKAGLDANGMPVCVEREPSISGFYELFFVKGVVSKNQDEPTPTRWLLAGRVMGEERLPDPVRAIQILCRLGEPWREWATDAGAKDALLQRLGTKGLPRSPELVKPLTSEALADLMKDFYADRVDLSHLDPTDERLAEYRRTRGRFIQSRQWRKTWANWMIRVDKRLLPAIAQQFHHRTTILTEEAYIGKDAMQLGLVESAAMTRAVTYMRRAMLGEEHVGGGMRKVVRDGMEELRASISGISQEGQEHRIRSYLLERDIRIWFSPHGKCFVGLLPMESRCHDAARTTDWSNQTPSFANRNPKLCSGCRCFAVDEDDLPFWTERYLENWAIWRAAVTRGMEADYELAFERAQQSANVLKSLEIDVSTLAEEVRGAAHH